MLIDLHCHTRLYSACSALTPEALVRAARLRGLDGVCITEHDALWTIEEMERAADGMDFLVLRGIEVTTEVGHVLVYGLREFTPAATLASLTQAVRGMGGLMYLAHPSRAYGGTALDIPATFDSVESQNGTEGLLQNDNAAAIARRCRLPGIGGSDAHSAREVGVCATRFTTAISDEATFLTALRAGAYEAMRIAGSE